MDPAVMELEIGPGPEPGSYVARVLRSVGGGEPTETFHLDLDELVDRRPLLEASVLSSAVSTRRVMSDTEAVLQDVGRRLFDAAFAGSVGTAYRTSLAVASERGLSVQVSLRLTAPGLAALPWEALYDADTDRYLCRKEPLVRNVPAAHTPVLRIAPPLRVLGMISSPRGLPMLDVEVERERLEQALGPHIEDGRVELSWLEDLTWDGLHAKLLEGSWHVLHFIGHGAYDTATDEGVLAFVGRDGRADHVSASAFADLLDEAEPTPRLVVLNSCQSGTGGPTDLFSGTAAALARSGIHAVAAMQFSISDDAALAFSRGFYTALAHNRGIDEAVRSGRIGILGAGRGTLEWVTPVLYLRGDAQLFDLGSVPTDHSAEPRSPAPADATGRPPGAAPPRTQAASARTSTDASVPGSRAPTPAGERATRRPTWRRWALAGGAAVVAIGAVVTALLLIPFGPDPGGAGGSGDQPSTAELAVPLDVDWVDVGLYCTLGDEFVIEVSGRGWLDETADSQIGPDGLPAEERPEARVLPDANTGSVIGRLDTTPERFPVGTGTTYVCPAQGGLMLGINDTDLENNSGEFGAVVTLNQ
ncbi:CHAT domain-containing protein [Microbacterium sp. LWH3-1.2]|uniref:CHAT domain-containing protein n=1 Tax=Microbacterium sp. LWH3-1.2 TaxID=3135256 RepID=UPI00343A9F67